MGYRKSREKGCSNSEMIPESGWSDKPEKQKQLRVKYYSKEQRRWRRYQLYINQTGEWNSAEELEKNQGAIEEEGEDEIECNCQSRTKSGNGNWWWRPEVNTHIHIPHSTCRRVGIYSHIIVIAKNEETRTLIIYCLSHNWPYSLNFSFTIIISV